MDQQPYDQNQTFSIDYLNQIAPKQNNKLSLFNNKKILLVIIGLALIVVVSIISIVINSVSDSAKKPYYQLGLRLKSTQTISQTIQSELKSTSLRTTNSSLELYLANINRDITTPLKNNNIALGNANNTLVSQENGKTLLAKLEDARLNAILDRTYASEMAYQLDTILVLMQQIYTNTKSASMKSFLSTSYANLSPIQKQFANYNDTVN
jgi:hypothetical protein